MRLKHQVQYNSEVESRDQVRLKSRWTVEEMYVVANAYRAFLKLNPECETKIAVFKALHT